MYELEKECQKWICLLSLELYTLAQDIDHGISVIECRAQQNGSELCSTLTLAHLCHCFTTTRICRTRALMQSVCCKYLPKEYGVVTNLQYTKQLQSQRQSYKTGSGQQRTYINCRIMNNRLQMEKAHELFTVKSL